jgi:hypothetical protein
MSYAFLPAEGRVDSLSNEPLVSTTAPRAAAARRSSVRLTVREASITSAARGRAASAGAARRRSRAVSPGFGAGGWRWRRATSLVRTAAGFTERVAPRLGSVDGNVTRAVGLAAEGAVAVGVAVRTGSECADGAGSGRSEDSPAAGFGSGPDDEAAVAEDAIAATARPATTDDANSLTTPRGTTETTEPPMAGICLQKVPVYLTRFNCHET